MNERYPDGSLSHLYDFASNREETCLGLRVPIPSPDEVFPAKPEAESLDDLLAQVTPENRHPATEWGNDVGQEAVPL